ncbi:MAG: TIM barrel protein [Candidatus Aenigmarchaeota archaeon]|nr:TIM barrel protein [Candidatus Aenigmarchaeota archaeon]MDW8149602.1 TIM barrel protein [Candidatus Aenigmarchaeota archaeon]
MFEIRLGPAGIPISSKVKNTIEGIKTVKEIGLNAMEIEFVRNIYIKKKDTEEIKNIANSLDVKLSVHAPYFINLLSENEKTVKKSKEFIIQSSEISELIDSRFVVIHAAYYKKLDKKTALEKMKEISFELIDKLKELGIKNTKLAYETMGKESQFATLDEILELVREVGSKYLTVCVDFSHIFVRNNGKIDYKEIFDKIEKNKIDYLHTHFTGVKYNLKTKKFIDIHTPINSNPSFKKLAQEILKRKINITIISESPILEKDSIKMKKVLEEFGYRF